MHLLLVKTSSLGDVVHNLPIVADIQRHIPGVVIDWVVEESCVDIPHLHPGVRRVIPVALRRWRKQLLSPSTWGEIAAFRRDLRKVSYDVVLDTQGLLKSALITKQAALANQGRRLGYAIEAAREPLAARFYDAGFVIPKNAHAVERNRWLAAAALGYALDRTLDYGAGASPLTFDWLSAPTYAVLLTGTSREDKLWPEADWVALGRSLPMPVVLPAGNAVERERAARLAQALPGAVTAPPLGVAALAGLMAGAQLVIGLDTGLTHLATALNKPTLAIFSGSNPDLTGVLAGSAGVAAINLGHSGSPPAAEQVIAAARNLLP